MRRLGLLFFVNVFFASAAGEQWVRLTTPHFEMYTTGGEKRARETILYFEQIRSFFSKAATVKSAATEFPVRVIAFKSPKQYEPYSPNAVAGAFFVPGRFRDYIVMGDMEPEHLPGAIHEYTHLLIHHSGINLPLWLNEGLADLYSTLKPLGGKSMVGDLIPGRVAELQTEKWLPFDVLTSVDHSSPIYNEKKHSGIFYSESWALAHMLYLSPGYQEHFSAFVTALAGGANSEAACQSAYGKTGAQVYKDLQAYLHRNGLFGALFDVKLSKSEAEALLSRPDEFESSLVSADLFAAINKPDKAKPAYEALAAKFPTRPEVPHSLGYLVWQSGDAEAARGYFEKAFENGTDDAQMCFHLGSLERSAGNKQKAIPALQRAIELRPDYTDARIELGSAYLSDEKYQDALTTLAAIKKVDAERAPRFFVNLSYAEAQLNSLTEARKSAEQAKKWSRTPQDQQQTENLLRFLDSREDFEKRKAARLAAANQPATQPSAEAPPKLVRKPPAPQTNPFVAAGQKVTRVEGTAKSLNCTDKGLTFSIQSGDKVLTFDMPKPDRVLLKHNGAATADFNCGPQKPYPVVVEFVPAANPGGQLAGELKMLEY